MSQTVLRSTYPLNNSRTEILTMGLKPDTLLPVYTLSGTRGQAVHLNANEIRKLVDDYSPLIDEHFAKNDPDTEDFPRTVHLSDQHNLLFSFFKEAATIAIAKRPEPTADTQLRQQPRRTAPQRAHEVRLAEASWIQLKNMLQIIRTMVHRYNTFSERAPVWLRQFAECVAASGGTYYPDPQPMDEREQIILERYYTDNCFKCSWRDVLETEYMDQRKDPTEIKFLEGMCTEAPDYVKEELLKVRNTPEFYAKVSYRADQSQSFL